MKISVFAMFVTGAALLAALSFAQSGPAKGAGQTPPAADPKKDALRLELDDLHAQNDALALELRDTRVLLERTIDYLAEQSADAKRMEAVLDDVEQKGFTFGINPESRTALLAGWRERLAAEQRNLPALAPKKVEKPAEAVKVDDGAKPTPKN